VNRIRLLVVAATAMVTLMMAPAASAALTLDGPCHGWQTPHVPVLPRFPYSTGRNKLGSPT
jgi:hypothetical protein